MQTLNLIAFLSDLNEQRNIRNAHKELFDTLETEFRVNLVTPDEYTASEKTAFTMVFISSGGTEGKFVAAFDKLPKPLVLLTDGLQNSLAASLEISTWARQRAVECSIIHAGSGAELLKEVGQRARVFAARQELRGKRIGVIGEPSSWLIASGVDYAKAREAWGVEYVDIPLSEVDAEYARADDDEARAVAETISRRASARREPSAEDLIKASKLYLAIKKVAENHGLAALTIQCFSLISSTGTTGCLALALLNDDGIVAGCEGDEQTVFTMLLSRALTGSPGFMSNPSQVDKAKNTILVAHCTIGLSQTAGFKLRSHFESGIGVAVQGEMPRERYTVVKCGGRCLDQVFACGAELVENTDFSNVCRTQVRLRMDAPVDYFLTRPIGNHHVIVSGDWADVFNLILK